MKSLLLSQFNFDEDWIYEDIRKNFTGNEKIVVCPLTFSPEKIENDKLWNAFYGKGYTGYEEIMRPLRKFGYTKEKEEEIEWLNYFKDSKEKFKENKNQVEALKKAQKEKYIKVIALGDKGALMIENNQMAEYGDIFVYND